MLCYVMYVCREKLRDGYYFIIKTVIEQSKQTKTKAFVFVVTLRKTVLNGSKKSRFNFF